MDEAKALLERAGFKIVSEQKRSPVLVLINGKRHLANVTADYLVKKEKKTYAVKVKNGLMTDPLEPATLRQLIEYDYVYKPEALLFLDMQNAELHEIKLEIPRSAKEIFLKVMVALFIILFLVGIIAVMIKLRLV
jgi:hypothetical protein